MDGQVDEELMEALQLEKKIEQLIKTSNTKGFQTNRARESTKLDYKPLVGSVSNKYNEPTKWDKMLSWQTEWKRKIRNNYKIYFDKPELQTNNNSQRLQLRKKIINATKRFQSHGVIVMPVFDNDIAVIISGRTVFNEGKHEDDLEMHVAMETKKVSLWDFDKMTRFFQNIELDLVKLIDEETDKLSDRLDSVNYFDNDSYIYMYDQMQRFAPLIVKRWDISKLNRFKSSPIPTLSDIGTYGRSPFIGDRSYMESSSERIKKRYIRDELNENFALRLRKLYQYRAKPDIKNKKYFKIQHNYSNSKKSFDFLEKLRIKRTGTVDIQYKSFNEIEKNNFFNGSCENNNDLVNRPVLLSSTDTIPTDELSDDMSKGNFFDHQLNNFEARSSIAQEDLNASIEDNDIHNESCDPYSKINLSREKQKYCENCKIFYTGLDQHRTMERHQLYSRNEENFSHIDRVLSLFIP